MTSPLPPPPLNAAYVVFPYPIRKYSAFKENASDCIFLYELPVRLVRYINLHKFNGYG